MVLALNRRRHGLDSVGDVRTGCQHGRRALLRSVGARQRVRRPAQDQVCGLAQHQKTRAPQLARGLADCVRLIRAALVQWSKVAGRAPRGVVAGHWSAGPGRKHGQAVSGRWQAAQ